MFLSQLQIFFIQHIKHVRNTAWDFNNYLCFVPRHFRCTKKVTMRSIRRPASFTSCKSENGKYKELWQIIKVIWLLVCLISQKKRENWETWSNMVKTNFMSILYIYTVCILKDNEILIQIFESQNLRYPTSESQSQ